MASTKASKRISSTSWIGSVGAEFDDFQVNLEENSRADLSSGEFQQILLQQQSDVEDDSDAEIMARETMKVAVEGFADMTLVEETAESASKTTTEKSSSTHNSSRRSGGRRKNQRMSLFTTVHTITTLVSSTYHSSDLDSFSEESDMDDSDDDDSLQASTKEGAGEEDEIKSILSSDFDSHDLDLEKNEGSDDDLEQNPRLSQRDNRSKLDWTNDQRWNTLETTPNFNPDPFVYPEGQQSSGSRMIMMSNSSIIPQVALDITDDVNAKPSGGNRKKLEIIFQGEDEISLNDDHGKNDDGNKEFAVEYNDKKKKKKSVADVLERDPDSEHSSFMLEVGMQRQVSGLTVQSGVGTQRSQRTRRRGSKRNRSNAATAALQNETWNNYDDDDEEVPTRHTNDAIPNQPLPPPPPQSETPLFGRRSFTGTEIIAQHKSQQQQQQKRGSHFSKVSKVSALSVPSDMEEEPNYKNTTSQRSRADSFDSSWDSSLGVSPITKNDADKKKIRMDGDSVITSPDNPTFRATDPLEEQLDVPPPPPARCATPRASFQLPFANEDDGRPQLVDLQNQNMSKTSVLTFDHDDGRPQLVDLQHHNMSKTSVLTFDSGGVVSSSKQRNRNSLEKLNDQMNAAIGVSSPSPGAGNNNSKASSIRMSIGQRRESVKRLREKLRDSFKHVISPGGSTTRGRKSLGQE